jgi:PAS domain-containing protein
LANKLSKGNGAYFIYLIAERCMSDSKKKKKTVKPAKARMPSKTLETVQFERLLANISARFINLSYEEVNGAITESLECVSQILGVDRCSLLEFHEDLSIDPNFFCYNAPGIKTVTAAGPPSPDSYLRKMVREGKTICFNRLDELPQEAMVDLEYLQSRGVKSMLFIPVQGKNHTVTVLALSGIRSEYHWPEELKPRLRLLAEVFTRVLKQKQTEEAILREKQFTETAINGLPGIFYVYDSDWRMIRWNRNHELLTGFSADELKGRMLLDWFSEDFKSAVSSAVRKVFEEGEAMVEAPLLIKGGGPGALSFQGGPS